MTHPLTDKIISNQFGRYDGINDERVYDEDDIRAAYDLGHKAGVKVVEDYLKDKLYIMPKVLRPTKKQEPNS